MLCHIHDVTIPWQLQEPLNLAGKNSFKHSGLVNKKAVGIESGPDGKGVCLVTKKQTSESLM